MRVLSEQLAQHGISAAQWTVLRALWREDGCSQIDLAAMIKVEKASLTQVLVALEEARLIKRERCQDDRRRWLVHLTPAGRKLQAVLLPVAVHIEKQALTGFSQTEAAAFRKFISKAMHNLESL